MWRLIAGLVVLPLVLVGSGWLFSPPGTLTGWAVVNVLVYPVILVASIALHEGGHALVARLLRLRVPRIDIGIGRRVARWRWRRTSISIHAFPLLGVTYLGADRVAGLRWRLWLTILAGPITTALIAIGALAVLDVGITDAFWPQHAVLAGPAIIELVAFQAIWSLVVNLLPVEFHAGFSSDGLQLLRIPTVDSRQLEELRVLPAVLEAEELSECGQFEAAHAVIRRELETAPDSWALRNSLALMLMHREQLHEARVLMLELLKDDDSIQSLVIRNNVAWVDFLINADEFREEANDNSRLVLTRFKDAAFALGTRGAVLGWLGRHDEAIAMLQQAYLRNNSDVNRALNACSLACSFAATGRVGEARRWVERARASHPGSALLGRAEAAIERAFGSGNLP
jgi:tetratricopeptide (TPR) repeat protein